MMQLSIVRTDQPTMISTSPSRQILRITDRLDRLLCGLAVRVVIAWLFPRLGLVDHCCLMLISISHFLIVTSSGTSGRLSLGSPERFP